MYASGLVGSNATTFNPRTPTTSPVTARSHYQPQPQFLSDTAATAPLQNHRDHPHLAGNEACLCSSCHIRDSFFPRSLDGRIVLPHPSLFTHSGRLPRPAASMTSPTPLATPSLVTRKRNRTESTASNHDLRLSVAKFNEGRRGGGPRTQLQSDRGEGSSSGTGRMSDEPPHTPQMSRQEEQPFPGLSRHTQFSKKHDYQPNSWPRIRESEDFSEQPSHQSSSSQHVQLLDESRLESFLDKHGTVAHHQNHFQVPQTTKLEAPRSTTPLTVPPHLSHVGANGYERHPISSPPHQGKFAASFPETPGSLEHHDHHYYHHHHHSTSHPESPTDVVLDKPKIVRFSSRSKNPQPNNNPPSTMSGERSVNSSPARDPQSSSSHYLPPSQFEEGSNSSSSSSFQTQIRFQEPVVPENHVTSPIRPRELSIVQVKWDSERKRRQGYFAQEEGAEKSPFRHYNKANCDFES